jgi:hypothetical protein
MPKITVTVVLDNGGGPFHREAREVENDPDAIDHGIGEILAGMVLSIGDTIKIYGPDHPET